MVEFYYNCSFNEASQHSSLEAMYGYQPSTHADRLLPLITGVNADATNRLTLVLDTRDVVKHLLQLYKEKMAANSTRFAPLFQSGDLVYLSTKRLHFRSHKCKHLRDQRLGPFKVIFKVNWYSLLEMIFYLRDVDYIRCFIVTYCLMLHRQHL